MAAIVARDGLDRIFAGWSDRSTSSGNLMVDELTGRERSAGPASGLAAPLCADPGAWNGCANGYWNAWTRSRLSLGNARRRTTAAGGVTALERTLEQKLAELEETRAPAPRPGRATGEGMERVADPTRGRSPLARRGLGAHRAANASTVPGASERHPHAHSQVQGQPRGAQAALAHTPPLRPRPDRPRPIRTRITRSPRRSSDNSRPSPATCGAPPRRAAIPIEKGRRQAP